MARKFLTPIDLNKLELRNAAIQNLAEPPASPAIGQVYYDTDESKIKVWTGANWANVGSSVEEIEDAVANLVSASTGIRVIYNDDANILGIENVGILAVAGTTNQVLVNGGTSAVNSASVTLSLPATIHRNLQGNVTGNASTATSLQNPRTISLSGGASGSVSFDGTSNVVIPVTIDSESAVSSITGTANEINVSASVGAVTVSLPDTIFVDVNGNVTGDLTGNADTASALQTGRSIGLYGDVSGSVVFDGSANVNINATIQPDSVALGTDTTGNYVQSITGTANEIEVSGSGESAAVTIGLPDNVIIPNDLTVTGALTVSGSTTFLNVETLTVEDNLIVLNSNATTAVLDSGIEVERGTAEPNVQLLWKENVDQWQVSDGTNYHAIARKHSANVGDNSSSAIVITHNLNTRDVEVQIYTAAAPYDTVEADVERTTVNTVTLKFAVAPATNEYRVVVTG
jgi:hypothetical protein